MVSEPIVTMGPITLATRLCRFAKLAFRYPLRGGWSEEPPIAFQRLRAAEIADCLYVFKDDLMRQAASPKLLRCHLENRAMYDDRELRAST
jgi:hypothetical protein